jgi:hypothetical protein
MQTHVLPSQPHVEALAAKARPRLRELADAQPQARELDQSELRGGER